MSAAVISTVALVLADSDAFGYGTALTVSIGAALATISAIFQAVTWMVVVHGSYRRGVLVLGAIIVMVAPPVALFRGASFTSGSGLLILLVICLGSAGLGTIAVGNAPAPPLWRRASAVESMRSSMQTFDFQRVFLDLRNASEQPPAATGRRLAWKRLPTAPWRHFAAVQHVIGWHLARVVAIAGFLAVLFWWGDTSQGIVALGISACALFLGLEFAGSVAATADQLTFIVHYPAGSGRILRSQVITTILMAMVVGTAVVGGGAIGRPRSALGVLVLVATGALGASVQARLGSPDLVAAIERYGIGFVGAMLWARALLGPLLALAVTIAVFHQFLRPEPLGVAVGVGGAVVPGGAFLISTRPLERIVQ